MGKTVIDAFVVFVFWVFLIVTSPLRLMMFLAEEILHWVLFPIRVLRGGFDYDKYMK